MKKSMKKSLAIVLASLVYMENTSLMASGVEEISQDTQLNTPQNTFWGSLPEDVVVKSGSYLSLQEIFKGMFLCKDFNRNNWVNKAIKHLHPRATPEDINAFLKSPFSNIPFYYAPKNAIQHINKIFTKPGSWELTLSILNNKDHATGDQKLFVQKSLLYPEAIEFLKKTPAIMDQINLSPEEKESINKRWSVLENLRARAPAEDIFQIVKNELYLDLRDLGWMFISTNSQVEIDNRFKAISELLRFENPDNPYTRPQATKDLLSIAADNAVNVNDRFKAAYELDAWGDAYKTPAAKAFLSIAADNAVNFDNRLKAANKLRAWGDAYKTPAEKAFLSIATCNAVNSYDRLDAVQTLLKWGETYKLEIAEVCLSISMDNTVRSADRNTAAWILDRLREIDKTQVAQAFLSIITDNAADDYYRLEAVDTLIKSGWKKTYNNELLAACLSIAINDDSDEVHKLKAMNIILRWPDYGKFYKRQNYRVDEVKI